MYAQACNFILHLDKNTFNKYQIKIELERSHNE